MTVGHAAFLSWPKNADKILDVVASRAIGDRRNATAPRYGQLGLWVSRNFDDKDLKLELRPVKELLADHWRRRTPFYSSVVTPHEAFSELRQRFDISEEHFSALAGRFGFMKKCPAGHSPSDFYFEQIEASQKLKAFLEQTMSSAQTRESLGISAPYLNCLDDAGILSPRVRVEDAADTRYSKSDVEILLRRLRGRAPSVRTRSPGFASIPEFHRIFQIAPDFVISAVSQGLIGAAAHLGSERGMRALLVSVRDVRTLWQETVGRPNGISWRFVDPFFAKPFIAQPLGIPVQISSSL